jgi:integrase
MAKAKRLPSGNWNVKVFAGKDKNGKQIRKSFTAPTKAEAEYMAAEFKARHKEVTRDTSAMTLSEGIDKYIEFKGGTLSPSTIRGYRHIQKHAFPSIMGVKINKLSVMVIQAAINEEIETKKEKTIRNEIGLIKAVLKLYAPNLSLTVLTLPKSEPFVALQLALDEVKTLIQEIKQDECAIPLYLAICGGLRASEIVALKFEDYDSKKRIIRIHRAIVPDENNRLVAKATKTKKSTRSFSIPPFLADMINALPNQTPEKHIVNTTAQSMRNHLHRICQKNHIPCIRLHDLRHINASVMAYLGIPQKYALERGGWDDIQTMDKIYQYTFKDEKQAVDDKINDFFTELFEG